MENENMEIEVVEKKTLKEKLVENRKTILKVVLTIAAVIGVAKVVEEVTKDKGIDEEIYDVPVEESNTDDKTEVA